jgi:uncharacterized protein YdaU (DUF1376 family)
MGAPWFKIHVQEFLSDSKILKLSNDKIGILLRLWCIACNDGCIPSNPKELSSLIPNTTPKQMLNHMLWIRTFFSESKSFPGALESVRLQRELAAYESKVEKLRESGRKGGNSPKANAKAFAFGECEANASKMLPEVEVEVEKEVQPSVVVTAIAAPKPNGKPFGFQKEKPPREKKPKPETERLEDILGGKDSKNWERFWKFVAIWGRDKVPAPKKLAVALLAAFSKAEPKEIYSGGLHYRDEFLPPNRKQDETQFMKSPLAWLEEEAWIVELHDMESKEAVNA